MAIATKDNMKPGSELDALIAEKVMGEPQDYAMAESGLYPKYSTDIKAAWEVVEKMGYFEISYISDDQAKRHYGSDKGWADAIYKRHLTGEVLGRADTAPHAICLAALKAVGCEVGERLRL